MLKKHIFQLALGIHWYINVISTWSQQAILWSTNSCCRLLVLSIRIHDNTHNFAFLLHHIHNKSMYHKITNSIIQYLRINFPCKITFFALSIMNSVCCIFIYTAKCAEYKMQTLNYLQKCTLECICILLNQCA